MKEERILNLLGEVAEEYIVEADLGQRRLRKPRHRKTLLLVACLLMAMGIIVAAAKWFGLWDMLLPQKMEVIPSIQQDAEQKPYEVDAVSLAGFVDSPESKANIQWQAFLKEYNYSTSTNEIFAPGTSYTFYLVFDQTMADKLDEIAAQYKLKLHTGVSYVEKETLCSLVGGDFMGENQGCGYIYEDGSFHLEGNIELPEYGMLNYQMTRNVKGTFSDVILSVGDISQWQEWGYTMKDGRTVVLALSPNRGLIIAEMPDSFVTINVLAGTETDVTDIFSSGPIGSTELEALAESFDFTLLSPALPVDIGAVEQSVSTEGTEGEVKEEPNLPMLYSYGNAREAYADVLEDLLVYRTFPDGYPYTTFDDTPDLFALMDVNGDGEDELLINATNTAMADMRLYVMAFDKESGKLREELLEWPAVTFYGNGLVKAERSHNHGMAGDALWPYTLYRYDDENQRYTVVAMVDAWDRQFGETYLEEVFPAEADTSGTGVVYYVMDAGNYELKDPMDISEYRSWCDSWFGSKQPILISWKELTEAAIQEMREEAL